MEADESAKADWILKVLGLAIPQGGVSNGSGQPDLETVQAGANGAEASAEAESETTEQASDDTAPDASATAPDWKTARQAWQDANDSVNDQINGLGAKMLERAKAGDDGIEGLAAALNEIAETGLNAITEDHRVKLIASVMAIGDGGAEAMLKHGPKALSQITEFQAFLSASEMVKVCDANPFGAPVSIHSTLSPPLQQMAAALQAATAN